MTTWILVLSHFAAFVMGAAVLLLGVRWGMRRMITKHLSGQIPGMLAKASPKPPSGHVLLKPGECTHGKDADPTCAVCCELSKCRVCGGVEGEMPTQCPGTCMDKATRAMVLEGKLDYFDNEWKVRIR